MVAEAVPADALLAAGSGPVDGAVAVRVVVPAAANPAASHGDGGGGEGEGEGEGVDDVGGVANPDRVRLASASAPALCFLHTKQSGVLALVSVGGVALCNSPCM